MAKYAVNITDDGAVLICRVNRRRDANYFTGTLLATGAFDGASIALGLSIDGGTTVAPINDANGAVAITAATTLALGPIGDADVLGENLDLYATASSAGDNTDVEIIVLTNQ